METKQFVERKSAVEVLSETHGWPLKIERDGYVAHLHSAQPLINGQLVPIYRFPGGLRVVDDVRKPSDE